MVTTKLDLVMILGKEDNAMGGEDHSGLQRITNVLFHNLGGGYMGLWFLSITFTCHICYK